MRAQALLFAGLLAQALANPVDHVLHEKRDVPEHGDGPWQKLGSLPSDIRIPVRLAMKQPNTDNGMDLVMAVSDPRSESYGKHYKPEDVVNLFAPDEESFDTVKAWLVSAGISSKSIVVPRSKGWVHFDATVSQLESALGTKYYRYEYTPSGERFFGTDEYHLPSNVSDVVDFIIPAVAMARHVVSSDEPTKRRRRAVERALPGTADATSKRAGDVCDFDEVTMDCIKALYNIPCGTLNNSKSSIGIYSENSFTFAQSDLNKFYQMYAPGVPKGWGPSLDGIDGAKVTTNPKNPDGEASLDVSMVLPIVYPQRPVFYQTKTQTELGLFNQFLDALDGPYCDYSAFGETGDDPTIDGKTPNEQCGVFKPAAVISSSYSFSEFHYPASYLKRQCNEFMKLALQGTTYVSASGDSGLVGDTCQGPNSTIWAPDGYSSCPYVLSVGGSGLPFDAQPGGNQTSARTLAPGSGFSNIHLVPDYQKDTVNAYFKNHNLGIPSYTTKNGVIPTTGGVFNRNGRAYPDVSAIADNVVTILNGTKAMNGGTSISAPVFAAILSLINEERVKAGKSLVGFAQPVFYAHPEMFNDITVPGERYFACTPNQTTFKAVKGWDPVTGLGTPNYPAMLKVFMDLP